MFLLRSFEAGVLIVYALQLTMNLNGRFPGCQYHYRFRMLLENMAVGPPKMFRFTNCVQSLMMLW